jgi:hypothetical protein
MTMNQADVRIFLGNNFKIDEEIERFKGMVKGVSNEITHGKQLREQRSFIQSDLRKHLQ